MLWTNAIEKFKSLDSSFLCVILFILFLAVLGLSCCTDFSPVAESGACCSVIVVCGLLIPVASLVVELGR